MKSTKSEHYLVHLIRGLSRPTKKRIICYIVVIAAIVTLAILVPISIYNQLLSGLREYLQDPAVFVALMVGAGSIVVGLVTYAFQNKQLKLNGLLEAFKLLNDPAHREARERLHSYFELYKDSGYKDLGVFMKGDRLKDVSMVRADFDQMGMLVKKGGIYKDEFLEGYGYNAYQCWEMLKDHIRYERSSVSDRKFDMYMKNFEDIAGESFQWKDRQKKLPSPYDS